MNLHLNQNIRLRIQRLFFRVLSRELAELILCRIWKILFLVTAAVLDQVVIQRPTQKLNLFLLQVLTIKVMHLQKYKTRPLWQRL